MSENGSNDIRVLVVGLGTMGLSHARAYRAIDGFELAGLCTHHAAERRDLDKEFPDVPRFEDLTEALAAVNPDAVAICTYTEITRRPGASKRSPPARMCSARSRSPRTCSRPPSASSRRAKRAGKALLIGYILRVHPSWTRFVEIGRTLGKPLVMRMNLNQQSSGSHWRCTRTSCARPRRSSIAACIMSTSCAR